MKKSILFALSIFFIKFVSAQFFRYGYFSIEDFFYSIDPTTMTFGVLFVILFALIYFILSRFFTDRYGRPNKAIPAIISAGVSLLTVYWMYYSGFDLEYFLYSIGFYGWGPLLAILIVIGLIILFFKRGRRY